MIQRVGLDLDNTIIDYDAVFVEAAKRFGYVGEFRSKSDVRDHVRTTSGDESWQRIQGWVYGEGLQGAIPYWGIHEFLRRCANRGLAVFIVSHKTERGHFASADVSLRAAAVEWLYRESLCGPVAPAVPLERVHFCDDRAEKIRRIAALQLDVFVDDLPEVLTDPEFPDRTRRVGFRVGQELDDVRGARSWREVGDSILGVPEPIEVAELAATEARIGTIERVVPIATGGNSTAFDVLTSDGRFLVKRYPDRQFDSRRRCETETKALGWLGERGLPVPPFVWADGNLGLAVHGFVLGASIDQPTIEDIDVAANFVGSLAELARSDSPEFDDASEHFDSVHDLITQVERRLDVGERSAHPQCAGFFGAELRSAFERETVLLRARIGDSMEQSLPAGSRTLSPSDFGFHNSLRTESGIVFLDFEYFGWDDPAKLVSDFLLHPGFWSTRAMQGRWLERAESTFGSEVVHRALTILPLVAIRWQAIIMKPFLDAQGVLDDGDWAIRRERAEAVRATALTWRR